jgi:hypothetical protein
MKVKNTYIIELFEGTQIVYECENHKYYYQISLHNEDKPSVLMEMNDTQIEFFLKNIQ